MHLKWKIMTLAAITMAAIMTAGCCCCFTGSGTADDQTGSAGGGASATPAYTPTPRPTPTPAASGFSKTNPASIGTAVQYKDSWITGSSLRITCLEAYRGSQAYNMIDANDGYTYIKPGKPDEGDEYLIVKFRVEFLDHKSSQPEDYSVYGGDFKCYSPDNVRVYSYMWMPTMEPELSETLFKGDSAEGWVTFQVKQGYSNYLVSFENDKIWFTV